MTVGTGTPPPPPQNEAEKVEARLRSRGLLPFIADLEACQRVGAGGLVLFRQMLGGLADELAKQMQGKLASLYAENHYFAGRLARVQAELDSQRDFRFFDLSSENWSLKEEAEKLRGIQEKLSGANVRVAEQNKLLEIPPTIEAERDSAQKSREAAQAEDERLRTRVAELTKLNEEAEIRFGKASASGFQKAVDLTAALATEVNRSFFIGKFEARGGKILLGDQMAYDPAEHVEEEEESPEADGEQVGDA